MLAVLISAISSVITILIVMMLGYLLQRNNFFPDNFAGAISTLVVKVALPASVFGSVVKFLQIEELPRLASGFVLAMLAVIICYGIAFLYVEIVKPPVGRRGLIINGIVNTNTLFVGLPINVALFGNGSFSYFLVYLIVNTIATWSMGVILIERDDPTIQRVGKRPQIKLTDFFSPPLIGFLLGLAVKLTGWSLPNVITSPIGYIGSLVTPLSLLYIGIELSNFGLASVKPTRDAVMTMIGRFIVSPLILVIVIMGAIQFAGIHLNSLFSQTLVIQSATPILTVLPILAQQYHGDVKFAINVLVSSIILFMIEIPVLMVCLQFLPLG